jgi:2-octaprenyl-6-methoxyphenol hydroxylase
MSKARKTTAAIAVVGGGPIGLCAAIALARQGQQVHLIAPATPPVDDRRTVALLAASWSFLEAIGLPRHALTVTAPLATMQIVDATGSLFRTPPVTFRASEVGLEAFGWNIPLVSLVAELEALAARQPAIIRHDTRITAARCMAKGVELTLADGTALSTATVIAADGKDSLLRDAAGIATRRWDYPQTAITARLSTARPHKDVSTEFHTRQGPCTLVPMPGNEVALVWMMDPERADSMRRMPAQAFADAVETQTQSIVGRMKLVGERGLIPIAGLSVETLATDHVALVGEAAHLFPPIGAQGLNMGLRDVRALVEAVDTTDDRSAALRRYARDRRFDVTGRSAVVDLANRSLLAPFLPIDLLRGIGLAGLAHIGPLRRLVMRGGLAGGKVAQA